jgi:DNA polymerase
VRIITLDFETYYDKEYTLTKLTTEEYIRSEQFEAIMVGYKIDDGPSGTVVGPKERIQAFLDSLDIPDAAVLAHHAQFDGLILSHHFNLRPRIWFDTLAMARPVLGLQVGGSLAKLADHFKLPPKGDAVMNAIGKHLRDFSPAELKAYRAYCEHDVDLEYQIFHLLRGHFSKPELKLIDLVTRMFTEPVLEFDVKMLEAYTRRLRAQKLTLLLQAGVTLEDVMSNEKFAEALRRLGVQPPVKMSPTTGRQTYAFAKTDWGLQQLAEHPSEAVQTLVAARLGNKSTINETRAERMIGTSARGPAPVYLKYYGANQTGRMSGGDKMNWQNLTRGSVLRKAVRAPAGHVLVVVDSRNIESRVLDWLAGYTEAIEAYRAFDRGEGPDAYCLLATKIYGREITPEHKVERFVGKVAKLGLGYQMGASKFQLTAINMGVKISLSEAEKIVNIYRHTNPQIVNLWTAAQDALRYVASNATQERYVDPRGLIRIHPGKLQLPNGLFIRYPELRSSSMYGEYEFLGGKTREKVYGGKVVENIVQALARIIVMEQTLAIAKAGYSVVLSVHDEVVVCVPEEDAEEAKGFMLSTMSTPPSWCRTLPVAAEAGVSVSYGEAK